MLIAVKLADQWTALLADLPADWSEAHVRVAPEQAADADEVARRLGGLGVGRTGDELVLTVHRQGGAATPAAVRRAFGRLDDARIWCRLDAGDVARSGEAAAVEEPQSLADDWDALLDALPADWSDLLCRLELTSSALLDRAALLTAPLNPARDGEAVAFTFRAARSAGYGTSPAMVRRCFERLDAEEIAGSVAVLRQLSETDRVGTQGPVWLVAGRTL